MQTIVKPIESRLEIASKVFSISSAIATPKVIATHLGISVAEFYEMSELEFFDTLYSFYHNVYTVDKRI